MLPRESLSCIWRSVFCLSAYTWSLYKQINTDADLHSSLVLFQSPPSMMLLHTQTAPYWIYTYTVTHQRVDECIFVTKLCLKECVLLAELIYLLSELRQLFCLQPVHLRAVSLAVRLTLVVLTWSYKHTHTHKISHHKIQSRNVFWMLTLPLCWIKCSSQGLILQMFSALLPWVGQLLISKAQYMEMS